MDALKEAYERADADRLTQIVGHLEKGHCVMLSVNEDTQLIEAVCMTGEDHLVGSYLGDPLPDDTCVKEGKTWELSWMKIDTSLEQARRDYGM